MAPPRAATTLSAADATAYEECFEKGTDIELDPDLEWEATPGLGASSWQLATITDLSDTEVGLTLSAADASSTGGMATILPVGDGKAYWPWADHRGDGTAGRGSSAQRLMALWNGVFATATGPPAVA